MSKEDIIVATGRRKRSIARIAMKKGTGKIIVNEKTVNEYMPLATMVKDLMQPLVATKNENNFDIEINVKGGGFSGQTGAIRLGITRALMIFDLNTDQTRDDAYRRVLKAAGFVTRDPRVKERKKYGLKKARRAPQFSKR